jgi:glycosyltransferase involved in cell wall biosynthesis
MKIIALMPVKNEAWILRTCLSSLEKYVDEIIVMDDNSTDNSVAIARSFNTIIHTNGKSEITYFSEHNVREKLLELGRSRGGTHFVFLDADETFSSNIGPDQFKEKVSALKPGEKLFLQWVPLWKSIKQFRQDAHGFFVKISKDFVFCDDKTSHHAYAYIGVNRTPGDNKHDNCTYMKPEDGVVLHFQYISWERNEYKQAWYKCSEYINGERSPRRINATYRHLLDDRHSFIVETPKEWIENIQMPSDTSLNQSHVWYIDAIQSLFKIHGIAFFEPLEIWHIDPLRKMFVDATGREPVPKTFPSAVLYLNDMKNKIKNMRRQT